MTENNETIENNETPVKEYKTKDYVRRANNKYKKNKYANDDEYRKKQIETCRKSQEKNKEKYKEKKRLYMQQYRAKKKIENIKSQEQVIQQMTTFTISTKS